MKLTVYLLLTTKFTETNGCAAQRTEDIIFVTLKDPAASSQSFQEIEKLAARPFILTEVGAAYHYELEKLLSERELHISPFWKSETPKQLSIF